MSLYRFHLWVTFPSGERIEAARLAATDTPKRGAPTGVFRYADPYLDHPHAFPLHPTHLPLGGETYRTFRPTGLFSAIEDSIPEGWGRGLLIRKHSLEPNQATKLALLERMGADAMGALSCSMTGTPPPPYVSEAAWDLELIVDAAQRIINGERVPDRELALLLNAGSSSGGARPKALIHEGGKEYLAKFPSPRDSMDAVRIEAASMEMAAQAGLDVPDRQLRMVGARPVFLIRRFDVTPEGGRNHLLSLRALLDADSDSGFSYRDIGDQLRRREVSYRPHQDVPNLVRQMTFNSAICNVDDHLRNFSVLHDHHGWRLAPSYDMVPARSTAPTGMESDTYHYHHIALLNDDLPLNRDRLADIARNFGLSKARVTAIFDQVYEAVRPWASVMEEFGVPGRDIDRLKRDIEPRLQLIGNPAQGPAPVKQDQPSGEDPGFIAKE